MDKWKIKLQKLRDPNTPIGYISTARKEIELFKSLVDGIEEQLVAQCNAPR